MVSKIIATALCCTIFSTQCAFAHKPESTFWAERKRKTTIARAPAHPKYAPVPPLHQIPSSARATIEALNQPSTLPQTTELMRAIPSTFGRWQAVDPSPARDHGRTVLLIEDVHQNLEAQHNISHALRAACNAGLVDVIGLEGSWGPINVSPFRRHAHPESVRKAADYLLRQHRISGPIHSAMQAGAEIPPLVGVDDPKHYRANIAAYRRAAGLQAPAREAVARALKKVSEEKARQFSPRLLALDALVSEYREGRLPLSAYTIRLAEFVETPSLDVNAFLEAALLEKEIDYSSVETERDNIVRRLTATLSEADVQELLHVSIAFRNGQINGSAYYRYLSLVCDRAGVALDKYKSMRAYIQYIMLTESIDARRLLRDIRSMEASALEASAATESERVLLSRTKHLLLTGKLLDFSLTESDWEEYRSLTIEQGDPDIKIQDFERFYQEASARNEAMANHLLEAMRRHRADTAALVVGGFHTSGLREALAKRSVSTLIFSPKITRVDTKSGSAYLSVFSQEKTPLENLFAGKKLFLARPALPEPERLGGLPFAILANNTQAGMGPMGLDDYVDLAPDGTLDAFESRTSGDHRVVVTARHQGETLVTEYEYDRDGRITDESSPAPRSATLSWQAISGRVRRLISAHFSPGAQIQNGVSSIIANAFEGWNLNGVSLRFFNILPRILFIGAILPHEIGHFLAGPRLGKRREYGLLRIITGFLARMPWKSYGHEALAGIKTNLGLLILLHAWAFWRSIPLTSPFHSTETAVVLYLILSNLLLVSAELFLAPYADRFGFRGVPDLDLFQRKPPPLESSDLIPRAPPMRTDLNAITGPYRDEAIRAVEQLSLVRPAFGRILVVDHRPPLPEGINEYARPNFSWRTNGDIFVSQRFLDWLASRGRSPTEGLATPPGEDTVERGVLLVLLQANYAFQKWNRHPAPVTDQDVRHWQREAEERFSLQNPTSARDLIETFEKSFPSAPSMTVNQLIEAADELRLTHAETRALIQPEWIYRVEIPVLMDDGRTEVFVGWRVHHNSALGPHKGGFRYTPNLDEITATDLSREMTAKTAVAKLPLGGAKGGVRVDTKKLSPREMERLTRGYVRGLHRQGAIGVDIDIPAPDMSTSDQVMAWFADEFIRLETIAGRLRHPVLVSLVHAPKHSTTPFLDTYLALVAENQVDGRALGIVTGKPVDKGGIIGRDEATARGVFYVAEVAARQRLRQSSLKGLRVALQGFGNVGWHTARILAEAGAIIVSIGEAKSAVFNPKGINVPALKEFYDTFGTFEGFEHYVADGTNEMVSPTAGAESLYAEADILIAAAREKEIRGDNVQRIHPSVQIIIEAANGPMTPEAGKWLAHERPEVMIVPDILANAGGVIVSCFEWMRNLGRLANNISLPEVQELLKKKIVQAAEEIFELSNSRGIPLRRAAYLCAVQRLHFANGNHDSGAPVAPLGRRRFLGWLAGAGLTIGFIRWIRQNHPSRPSQERPVERKTSAVARAATHREAPKTSIAGLGRPAMIAALAAGTAMLLRTTALGMIDGDSRPDESEKDISHLGLEFLEVVLSSARAVMKRPSIDQDVYRRAIAILKDYLTLYLWTSTPQVSDPRNIFFENLQNRAKIPVTEDQLDNVRYIKGVLTYPQFNRVTQHFKSSEQQIVFEAIQIAERKIEAIKEARERFIDHKTAMRDMRSRLRKAREKYADALLLNYAALAMDTPEAIRVYSEIISRFDRGSKKNISPTVLIRDPEIWNEIVDVALTVYNLQMDMLESDPDSFTDQNRRLLTQAVLILLAFDHLRDDVEIVAEKKLLQNVQNETRLQDDAARSMPSTNARAVNLPGRNQTPSLTINFDGQEMYVSQHGSTAFISRTGALPLRVALLPKRSRSREKLARRVIGGLVVETLEFNLEIGADDTLWLRRPLHRTSVQIPGTISRVNQNVQITLQLSDLVPAVASVNRDIAGLIENLYGQPPTGWASPFTEAFYAAFPPHGLADNQIQGPLLQSIFGSRGGPWVYGVIAPAVEELLRFGLILAAGPYGMIVSVFFSIPHALMHAVTDIRDGGFSTFVARIPRRIIFSLLFGASYFALPSLFTSTPAAWHGLAAMFLVHSIHNLILAPLLATVFNDNHPKSWRMQIFPTQDISHEDEGEPPTTIPRHQEVVRRVIEALSSTAKPLTIDECVEATNLSVGVILQIRDDFRKAGLLRETSDGTMNLVALTSHQYALISNFVRSPMPVDVQPNEWNQLFFDKVRLLLFAGPELGPRTWSSLLKAFVYPIVRVNGKSESPDNIDTSLSVWWPRYQRYSFAMHESEPIFYAMEVNRRANPNGRYFTFVLKGRTRGFWYFDGVHHTRIGALPPTAQSLLNRVRVSSQRSGDTLRSRCSGAIQEALESIRARVWFPHITFFWLDYDPVRHVYIYYPAIGHAPEERIQREPLEEGKGTTTRAIFDLIGFNDQGEIVYGGEFGPHTLAQLRKKIKTFVPHARDIGQRLFPGGGRMADTSILYVDAVQDNSGTGRPTASAEINALAGIVRDEFSRVQNLNDYSLADEALVIHHRSFSVKAVPLARPVASARARRYMTTGWRFFSRERRRWNYVWKLVGHLTRISAEQLGGTRASSEEPPRWVPSHRANKTIRVLNIATTNSRGGHLSVETDNGTPDEGFSFSQVAFRRPTETERRRLMSHRQLVLTTCDLLSGTPLPVPRLYLTTMLMFSNFLKSQDPSRIRLMTGPPILNKTGKPLLLGFSTPSEYFLHESAIHSPANFLTCHLEAWLPTFFESSHYADGFPLLDIPMGSGQDAGPELLPVYKLIHGFGHMVRHGRRDRNTFDDVLYALGDSLGLGLRGWLFHLAMPRPPRKFWTRTKSTASVLREPWKDPELPEIMTKSDLLRLVRTYGGNRPKDFLNVVARIERSNPALSQLIMLGSMLMPFPDLFHLWIFQLPVSALTGRMAESLMREIGKAETAGAPQRVGLSKLLRQSGNHAATDSEKSRIVQLLRDHGIAVHERKVRPGQSTAARHYSIEVYPRTTMFRRSIRDVAKSIASRPAEGGAGSTVASIGLALMMLLPLIGGMTPASSETSVSLIWTVGLMMLFGLGVISLAAPLRPTRTQAAPSLPLTEEVLADILIMAGEPPARFPAEFLSAVNELLAEPKSDHDKAKTLTKALRGAEGVFKNPRYLASAIVNGQRQFSHIVHTLKEHTFANSDQAPLDTSSAEEIENVLFDYRLAMRALILEHHLRSTSDELNQHLAAADKSNGSEDAGSAFRAFAQEFIVGTDHILFDSLDFKSFQVRDEMNSVSSDVSRTLQQHFRDLRKAHPEYFDDRIGSAPWSELRSAVAEIQRLYGELHSRSFEALTNELSEHLVSLESKLRTSSNAVLRRLASLGIDTGYHHTALRFPSFSQAKTTIAGRPTTTRDPLANVVLLHSAAHHYLFERLSPELIKTGFFQTALRDLRDEIAEAAEEEDLTTVLEAYYEAIGTSLLYWWCLFESDPSLEKIWPSPSKAALYEELIERHLDPWLMTAETRQSVEWLLGSEETIEHAFRSAENPNEQAEIAESLAREALRNPSDPVWKALDAGRPDGEAAMDYLYEKSRPLSRLSYGITGADRIIDNPRLAVPPVLIDRAHRIQNNPDWSFDRVTAIFRSTARLLILNVLGQIAATHRQTFFTAFDTWNTILDYAGAGRRYPHREALRAAGPAVFLDESRELLNGETIESIPAFRFLRSSTIPLLNGFADTAGRIGIIAVINRLIRGANLIVDLGGAESNLPPALRDVLNKHRQLTRKIKSIADEGAAESASGAWPLLMPLYKKLGDGIFGRVVAPVVIESLLFVVGVNLMLGTAAGLPFHGTSIWLVTLTLSQLGWQIFHGQRGWNLHLTRVSFYSILTLIFLKNIFDPAGLFFVLCLVVSFGVPHAVLNFSVFNGKKRSEPPNNDSIGLRSDFWPALLVLGVILLPRVNVPPGIWIIVLLGLGAKMFGVLNAVSVPGSRGDPNFNFEREIEIALRPDKNPIYSEFFSATKIYLSDPDDENLRIYRSSIRTAFFFYRAAGQPGYRIVQYALRGISDALETAQADVVIPATDEVIRQALESGVRSLAELRQLAYSVMIGSLAPRVGISSLTRQVLQVDRFTSVELLAAINDAARELLFDIAGFVSIYDTPFYEAVRSGRPTPAILRINPKHAVSWCLFGILKKGHIKGYIEGLLDSRRIGNEPAAVAHVVREAQKTLALISLIPDIVRFSVHDLIWRYRSIPWADDLDPNRNSFDLYLFPETVGAEMSEPAWNNEPNVAAPQMTVQEILQLLTRDLAANHRQQSLSLAVEHIMLADLSPLREFSKEQYARFLINDLGYTAETIFNEVAAVHKKLQSSDADWMEAMCMLASAGVTPETLITYNINHRVSRESLFTLVFILSYNFSRPVRKGVWKHLTLRHIPRSYLELLQNHNLADKFAVWLADYQQPLRHTASAVPVDLADLDEIAPDLVARLPALSQGLEVPNYPAEKLDELREIPWWFHWVHPVPPGIMEPPYASTSAMFQDDGLLFYIVRSPHAFLPHMRFGHRVAVTIMSQNQQLADQLRELSGHTLALQNDSTLETYYEPLEYYPNGEGGLGYLGTTFITPEPFEESLVSPYSILLPMRGRNGTTFDSLGPVSMAPDTTVQKEPEIQKTNRSSPNRLWVKILVAVAILAFCAGADSAGSTPWLAVAVMAFIGIMITFAWSSSLTSVGTHSYRKEKGEDFPVAWMEVRREILSLFPVEGYPVISSGLREDLLNNLRNCLKTLIDKNTPPDAVIYSSLRALHESLQGEKNRYYLLPAVQLVAEKSLESIPANDEPMLASIAYYLMLGSSETESIVRALTESAIQSQKFSPAQVATALLQAGTLLQREIKQFLAEQDPASLNRDSAMAPAEIRQVPIPPRFVETNLSNLIEQKHLLSFVAVFLEKSQKDIAIDAFALFNHVGESWQKLFQLMITTMRSNIVAVLESESTGFAMKPSILSSPMKSPVPPESRRALQGVISAALAGRPEQSRTAVLKIVCRELIVSSDSPASLKSGVLTYLIEDQKFSLAEIIPEIAAAAREHFSPDPFELWTEWMGHLRDAGAGEIEIVLNSLNTGLDKEQEKLFNFIFILFYNFNPDVLSGKLRTLTPAHIPAEIKRALSQKGLRVAFDNYLADRQVIKPIPHPEPAPVSTDQLRPVAPQLARLFEAVKDGVLLDPYGESDRKLLEHQLWWLHWKEPTPERLGEAPVSFPAILVTKTAHGMFNMSITRTHNNDMPHGRFGTSVVVEITAIEKSAAREMAQLKEKTIELKNESGVTTTAEFQINTQSDRASARAVFITSWPFEETMSEKMTVHFTPVAGKGKSKSRRPGLIEPLWRPALPALQSLGWTGPRTQAILGGAEELMFSGVMVIGFATLLQGILPGTLIPAMAFGTATSWALFSALHQNNPGLHTASLAWRGIYFVLGMHAGGSPAGTLVSLMLVMIAHGAWNFFSIPSLESKTSANSTDTAANKINRILRGSAVPVIVDSIDGRLAFVSSSKQVLNTIHENATFLIDDSLERPADDLIRLALASGRPTLFITKEARTAEHLTETLPRRSMVRVTSDPAVFVESADWSGTVSLSKLQRHLLAYFGNQNTRVYLPAGRYPDPTGLSSAQLNGMSLSWIDALLRWTPLPTAALVHIDRVVRVVLRQA